MTEKSTTIGVRASRIGHRQALIGLLALAVAAVLFTAMVPTKPLFSDNQNTKYLYGLAKAGYGMLARDWLVGEGSNLPIFDGLVFTTQKFLGPSAFHLWQLGANALYLAALMALGLVGWRLGDAERDRPSALMAAGFAILLGALHSTPATARLFEGVAHQYILSFVFEPASFGVAALAALALIRLGAPGWGAACLVVAAWVHPVYAIPGLMVIAGTFVASWRFDGLARVPWPALLAGAIGCVGAAAFAYSLLFPVDPAAQREAARIITEIRIPHHSWPAIWFDFDAGAKCALVAVAVFLMRRDPLGWILGTVAALAALSALYVHFTHDVQLALAAPWRASALVVPAAMAVVLARLSGLVADRLGANARLRRLVPAGLLLLAGCGLVAGLVNRVDDESWQDPAYTGWVAANARPGDLYLTPPDQDEFRLATGVPQYVSWKTHPHRGPAVLEWYRRLLFARAFSQHPDCAGLATAMGAGVTHLVVRDPAGLSCPGWHIVYDDAQFTIMAGR